MSLWSIPADPEKKTPFDMISTADLQRIVEKISREPTPEQEAQLRPFRTPAPNIEDLLYSWVD